MLQQQTMSLKSVHLEVILKNLNNMEGDCAYVLKVCVLLRMKQVRMFLTMF